VTRKQINELNANNMFSINDVAAVTDGNLYCVQYPPAPLKRYSLLACPEGLSA
jgi:hypothetical protein